MTTTSPNLLPIQGAKTGYELKNFLTSELTVDPEFQRDINWHHVKRLVAEFDADALGTLEIYEIQELDAKGQIKVTNIVVDGQHRLEALKMVGWTHAPCKFVYGKTRKDAAKIFDKINRNRLKTTPGDHYKSATYWGDEKSRNITDILDRAGVYFVSGRHERKRFAPNAISAHACVYKVYEKQGTDGLLKTLQFIKETWPGDRQGLSEAMLYGVARFYEYLMKYYPTQADKVMEATKDKIRNAREKIDALGYLQLASRVGRPGKIQANSVAEVLIAIYNKGKTKSQLNIWLLRYDEDPSKVEPLSEESMTSDPSAQTDRITP